jgi:hypothetical protein
MRKSVTLLLLGSAMLLAGCKDNPWHLLAKDCAVNDLNGDKVLYFGPSNVLGPGSVWREASADAGGGYRVRWDSTAIPTPATWAKTGAEFTCQGSKTSKISGGATAKFTSQLAPLNGQVAADLSRATSVEVKASKMKWDLLLEGPYEQAVRQLAANSAIRQDLEKPGRLVMYRALKVQGFEARMSFDRSAAAELQAKYSGGALQKLNGELGAGLNVKWTSETEMVITAPGDFYVAGELVPYETTGFASVAAAAKVMNIKKDVPVASEKQN